MANDNAFVIVLFACLGTALGIFCVMFYFCCKKTRTPVAHANPCIPTSPVILVEMPGESPETNHVALAIAPTAPVQVSA